MKKLTYYVLYSAQRNENLSNFLSQKNSHLFSAIPVLEPVQVLAFGLNEDIFNVDKAFKKLNRDVTSEEIAITLSHIKCWKSLAENELLDDEDFALVAESDINLVADFEQLALGYANKYPSYGIIKLSLPQEQYKYNDLYEQRLYTVGDELEAIIYSDIQNYNFCCSLYLIRKDLAKKLTIFLQESKPYWLANQFTEFHDPKNIAQACYLLGEVPQEKLQEKLENPLFSIIVPIYNVECYLEQCIESVISQDYQNYELILVDDGSQDNSIDICIKYAKKYKNIIFIHKTNGGLSDARNAGIQIARGKYLMFLDGDDYWNGKYVLSELSEIARDNVDLIINDATFLFNNGEVENYPINKNDLTFNYSCDFELLVTKNIYRPAAWTKIVLRELILEHQLMFPKGRKHEDLYWSFDLSEKIKTYTIYDSYFYIYRTKRKGSITEFVKVENTEDLLDIAIDKIKQILTHKNTQLLNGLKRFILNQKNYIVDCFEFLSNKEKKMLREKYETFKLLIDKLEES